MPETSSFLHSYGPWAVVAGASEGLGAAFAAELASRGLHLVLIARREDPLRELAVRLARAHYCAVRSVVLDLALRDSSWQVVEQTRDLDVGLLVYNAGYSAVGPFLDRPLEDHLREIDTNVRAPLALAYLFSQSMLERRARGGILLMSSLSGLQGSPYIANYAATKAYNQLLGEGLWEELRHKGIDVTACLAGAIHTPNYAASQPGQSAGASASAMRPEQVARAALDGLGKQPWVIPGRFNQLAGFAMSRLLPRRLAIRVMGRILGKMYGVR